MGKKKVNKSNSYPVWEDINNDKSVIFFGFSCFRTDQHYLRVVRKVIVRMDLGYLLIVSATGIKAGRLRLRIQEMS